MGGLWSWGRLSAPRIQYLRGMGPYSGQFHAIHTVLEIFLCGGRGAPGWALPYRLHRVGLVVGRVQHYYYP